MRNKKEGIKSSQMKFLRQRETFYRPFESVTFSLLTYNFLNNHNNQSNQNY